MSANPTTEVNQDFKVASERFQKARSLADLYAPKNVSDLLGKADLVFILNAGTPDQYRAGTMALATIRGEIIQNARSQLGSGV
jgi:hypothetical protein